MAFLNVFAMQTFEASEPAAKYYALTSEFLVFTKTKGKANYFSQN